MGTDIHAVFQKRDGDKWVDVLCNWDQSRHYFLFAWLADVRNGFGFAGVPTHEPVKPILGKETWRGLPADFEMIEEYYHPIIESALTEDELKWKKQFPEDYALPDGRYKFGMGDHTYTWLTLDEILGAERPGVTKTVGVVGRDFYEKWDGKTPPESWSGNITGPGVVVIDQPRNVPHTAQLPEMVTHVRIRFEMPDGLDYFVDEIRRLRNEHGPDTRMVFGFDS